MLFVGDEAEKQALLLGEPEVFFTTPALRRVAAGHAAAGQVDVERLTELVTDAWRMRVPDALVGDVDGDTGPG